MGEPGKLRKCYQPGMKLPTVYLMHGGGDDDTTFQRMSRVEFYAEQNNVMTVTPQVKDSFFLDTKYGIRYFTYITEELPVLIRSLFASSPEREDNFVVGMAMGGNGALEVSMRRPDLYAACVDLSGGIGCSIDTDNLVEQIKTIQSLPKLQGAFGNPVRYRGVNMIWQCMPNTICRNKFRFRSCFWQLGKMILYGMLSEETGMLY